MYSCREAILAALAASGPMESNDLKHECRVQATDFDSYTYMTALLGLVNGGEVVRCLDMDDTYDLPD